MTASSIQLKKLWWVGPLTVLTAIVGVLIVRAIAMAILPAPYAPGLAMLMLPIILTLIFVPARFWCLRWCDVLQTIRYEPISLFRPSFW